MSRCPHGASSACATPGCVAGVRGEHLVVAGPEAVAYFERASEVVYQERRASGLRVDRVWRWVEVRREPARRVAWQTGS